MRWNRRSHLVSRHDIVRIWPRHVLDSLSIQPLIGGPEVLDLGSGGGLPGIPLAIATPGYAFTLLDRSERKRRFLDQVVATLGLENVTVRCVDLVDLRAEYAATPLMDTIVARAVAPPATLWHMAQALLQESGEMVLMSAVCHAGARGDQDAVQRPAVPIGVDGLVQERHQMDIPGIDQQHEVLVVRKA